MKTETVTVVTKEEYIRHLLGKIERNHKTAKTGSRRGGVSVTAKEYAMSQQELSNVVGGFHKPSRRMLEQDGLQRADDLYVKIQGK